MSIKELAQEIAATVDKKGAAYGNAIDFVEKTLTELYPNGIPVTAYSHALITIRVLDKLKRLSTDPNAFGENPWEDIVGYALRGAEKSRTKPETYFLPVTGFWGFDNHAEHLKAHESILTQPTVSYKIHMWEDIKAARVEITDEDTDIAVDVLVELLIDDDVTYYLHWEIVDTLKDLGWSDSDIIETIWTDQG